MNNSPVLYSSFTNCSCLLRYYLVKVWLHMTQWVNLSLNHSTPNSNPPMQTPYNTYLISALNTMLINELFNVPSSIQLNANSTSISNIKFYFKICFSNVKCHILTASSSSSSCCYLGSGKPWSGCGSPGPESGRRQGVRGPARPAR